MSLPAAVLFFLAAVPARAAAPAAAPIEIEGAVAVVDGRAIMLSEYEKELGSTIAYLRRTNPASLGDPALMLRIRENTLEELITRELLVQAGKRAQMTVSERDLDDAVQEIRDRFKHDAETGRTLDDAEADRAFDAKLKADGVDYAQYRLSLASDVMARKVIARNVTEKLVPTTDAQAHAYFRKIEAYLASKSSGAPVGMDPEDGAALREAAVQVKAISSEGARVERILIRVSAPASENELKRALKTAQALKGRLDAGEDFEKLAREESEDSASAPLGGDIGYIVRGISEPALVKETFPLPVGRISDPILTDIGYNIVRVTEKRAARPPEFERFKGDLKTFLDGIDQKKKLRAFLQGARDKAVIERHLPP
jgi:parvulin-like peptidyl-prolyl isomerase